MVIVPFEGIGWLMTTPVGEIETPFTAVICVAVLGKLSALLSWFVSQKPYWPSAIRTMLPEVRTPKLRVPVRVVVKV